MRTPNGNLIHQRELRGWSQRRVAGEIGATEKRVSSWERGESVPSPHYQELLCALFKQDAQELGFIQARTSPIIISNQVEEYAVIEKLEQAESIVNLAWLAWFNSQPQQAKQEMLKLLPRLERIRHSNEPAVHTLHASELTIRVHGLLGSVYLDSMENSTALYHYMAAQSLASEIHDIDQATTYLALVGDVLRRQNDKLTAISRMELARDESAQASRGTRGHILQLLAYTYADTGNAPDFESTISEATDLLAHQGEGRDAAGAEFIPFEIFEIRGKANRDLGKPLAAIPYLEQAQKSLDGQIVTPRWHALLEISRSQAFCDAGDLEVGIDLAKHGFLMASACNSPRQMNRVRKLLRKLEGGEHKGDKRMRDLKELLYDVYTREEIGGK